MTIPEIHYCIREHEAFKSIKWNDQEINIILQEKLQKN